MKASVFAWHMLVHFSMRSENQILLNWIFRGKQEHKRLIFLSWSKLKAVPTISLHRQHNQELFAKWLKVFSVTSEMIWQTFLTKVYNDDFLLKLFKQIIYKTLNNQKQCFCTCRAKQEHKWFIFPPLLNLKAILIRIKAAALRFNQLDYCVLPRKAVYWSFTVPREIP